MIYIRRLELLLIILNKMNFIERIKQLLKDIINYLLQIWQKKVEDYIDNFELKWGWLIWIGEKETDYLFWASENIATELKFWKSPLSEVKYEYNQSAQYKTRNWCTLYSAVTQLSHLKDYQFSLSEIYEIGDKMIKDWKLDPDYWAYLSDAIDYTRRWWNNKFPNNQVISFKIDYLDKVLFDALVRSNYITQFWYRTSTSLHNDAQDDWIVQGDNFQKIGWHAVSKFKDITVDNYIWKLKYNRYTFKYFIELINNWVIYRSWYIFLNKR